MAIESVKSPIPAAFGRLCVETVIYTAPFATLETQPPSGGCVLKPFFRLAFLLRRFPAAFGRLCVETACLFRVVLLLRPAAFGRLCVETSNKIVQYGALTQPPSGGCVLKLINQPSMTSLLPQPPSGGCVLKPSASCAICRASFPAAFGRLCVETKGLSGRQ